MKGAAPRLVIAAAFFVTLVLAVPAKAVPITYEIKGVASGAIGGASFTDALVIVTLSGDTNNVTPVPEPGTPYFWRNAGTTTVNIQGKGTATVTDPTSMYSLLVPEDNDDDIPGPLPFVAVFVNDDIGLAAVGSDDLLDYDLRSPFGPLTVDFGGVGYPTGYFLHTTLGDLSFTSNIPPGVATFTARTPEPSSFVLLGIGVIVFAGSRLRGR